MPAVGPGTSIGGRYHLRQRLGVTDGVERWEADDTMRGRRVHVLVVPADRPTAAATLDAARRASSLTDPRLVGVLDAGEEAGLVHVVEEAPEGATTLAHLLADGGLPAPQARRIVRDLAEVLARAAGRGLHHLRLTPDQVLRRRDGSVALRGLAVQAALDGVDDVDEVTAARTDARALAALLHAALTATWPGEGPSALGPTPRVAGAPAAPSELVAAVPDDLERLITETLRPGGRRGALNPTQVASALREPDHPAPRPTAASADDAVPQLPHDLRTDVEHVPTKAEAAALAAAGATAAGAKAIVASARAAGERRKEREAEEADRRVPLAALATDTAPAEPVAPVFVQDVPTGTPSSRQASFVLALVSFGVLAALVAGIIGVVSMVGNIQRQLDAPPLARTYTATAPAVTVTVGAGGKEVARRTAAAPAASDAPVAIVGVAAYDPEGTDKAENNATVNNVRDGKADTYWRSQRYKGTSFGNLKSGVGVSAYLGDARPELHRVRLTLPDSAGQDVTIYANDKADKEGAVTLGSVKGAKGEVTIPVRPGTGGHSYVIVWFTNSPAMFGGNYAALSEISLS